MANAFSVPDAGRWTWKSRRYEVRSQKYELMLRAERVSFAYRAGAPLVVNDVSLAIAPGELVGILGPNGSGKTTLLKMLAGTLTPSAGTIEFDRRPLSSWKRRNLARRIALV